jgi:hypothetical protein
MPEALTHTRITWALSPLYEVSLRGPLCAHGVLGTPHREVRNNCAASAGLVVFWVLSEIECSICAPKKHMPIAKLHSQFFEF